MKSLTASLAILALVFFSYNVVRSRIGTNVVRAEEASKWSKVEIPLSVHHQESRASNSGYAGAEGFWESTSLIKDRQLIFPIAVKIRCTRYNKTCAESEATLAFGSLKAELMEYDITSWTENGIVANGTDEGNCGIGHRLTLDFKSNSVTVTDYPKKMNNSKNCQPFQDANTYILHGGSLVLASSPQLGTR